MSESTATTPEDNSNSFKTTEHIIEYALASQHAYDCRTLHRDNANRALKKKQKKERQKEKKNQDKLKIESVPVQPVEKVNKPEQSSSSSSSLSLATPPKGNSNLATGEQSSKKVVNSPQELNEPDIVVHESVTEMNKLSDNKDSDGSDIDFEFVVPAFIQSIVSQKDIVKKQKKNNDSAKGKEAVKETSHKADTFFIDDDNGFTYVKKASRSFCKTPEGFGNEALLVIRENNFELAINYLNRAIALDLTDSRHYINRSYCYLRVGEYSRALADITYASEHLSDILEMSRAKCREGQALCGLQDYERAELAFKGSINLAPDFLFAKRELKRMQVMRIVNMGFKERDALLALQTQPETLEAINLLSDESLTNTAIYDSSGCTSEDDDDDIFNSDTEEDPSNEKLLSKLLNYDPYLPEEPYIPEPPLIKDMAFGYNKRSIQAPSQERALRIIKAVPVAAKPKKNQGVNDMAVWVGSLVPQITDAMVTKRFSRFGKVLSIWRPQNESYAFVNFQCATSTQKALEEASYNGGGIELNGAKLALKPATNKVAK